MDDLCTPLLLLQGRDQLSLPLTQYHLLSESEADLVNFVDNTHDHRGYS